MLMCIYPDWDPPTVEHHTQPRARKPHKCDECRRQIEPGETYLRWDGIDCEGDGFVSKMCAHCRATIDLGAALTGCPKLWYWDQVHDVTDDEGGFVGDILLNHNLSFADAFRMLRRVVQYRRRWRRPDGSLYPLPEIPEPAAKAAA